MEQQLNFESLDVGITIAFRNKKGNRKGVLRYPQLALEYIYARPCKKVGMLCQLNIQES